MLATLLSFYRPAAHAPRLPSGEVPRAYQRHRWQMMLSIFVGCYLVGMNLAEIGIGSLVQRYGWNAGFLLLVVACLGAMACLATTWNMHDRGREPRPA